MACLCAVEETLKCLARLSQDIDDSSANDGPDGAHILASLTGSDCRPKPQSMPSRYAPSRFVSDLAFYSSGNSFREAKSLQMCSLRNLACRLGCRCIMIRNRSFSINAFQQTRKCSTRCQLKETSSIAVINNCILYACLPTYWCS
jgi:hypothetical protein